MFEYKKFLWAYQKPSGYTPNKKTSNRTIPPTPLFKVHKYKYI